MLTPLARALIAPSCPPGRLALWALREEVLTWPKPGLVSPVDSGSHDDMDFPLFERSIESLRDYFLDIYEAGGNSQPIECLRSLGIRAEQDMFAATLGINTHRGAIFTLGFLVAAAGYRDSSVDHRFLSLGDIVQELWGESIARVPADSPQTNGLRASRRYGVGGARGEAANGFRTIYDHGLPALQEAKWIGWNAAKVQCLFAMIAHMDDTNLLHRGGSAGLTFARSRAQEFLDAGGIFTNDGIVRAATIHQEFCVRRLSPGGAGDLLAATIFIDQLENSQHYTVHNPC